MLRRVAPFCRPVLLLVSFPRSRSPVVGVLGLCWMWHGVPFARQRRPIIGILRMCWLLPGSFDCFCCPRASVHRPSIACLPVFPPPFLNPAQSRSHAHLKANFGFEPLPLAIDQADEGNGGVGQVLCTLNNLIKLRAGGSVKNPRASEGLQTFFFILRNRGWGHCKEGGKPTTDAKRLRQTKRREWQAVRWTGMGHSAIVVGNWRPEGNFAPRALHAGLLFLEPAPPRMLPNGSQIPVAKAQQCMLQQRHKWCACTAQACLEKT